MLAEALDQDLPWKMLTMEKITPFVAHYMFRDGYAVQRESRHDESHSFRSVHSTRGPWAAHHVAY